MIVSRSSGRLRLLDDAWAAAFTFSGEVVMVGCETAIPTQRRKTIVAIATPAFSPCRSPTPASFSTIALALAI